MQALISKIGEKNVKNENEIEKIIGEKLFDSLKKNKRNTSQLLSSKAMKLMKKNLFLQVYEIRNKFRYLIHKTTTGKSQVIRNLLSCIIQKYKSYQVVKIEEQYNIKQLFEPIDIIYNPVQNFTNTIDCYFTQNIHFAYRCEYSKGKKGIEILHAFECYFCNNFHSTKKALEKHKTDCSQCAGVLYKFENRSIISFEDNYTFLGHLPFVVYFDFETTTGSDIFLNKKMYVISYCMIFAFHPKLKIDRISIYRRFQQNQNEIFDLSHLNEKMLQYIDPVTLNQLKDADIKELEKIKICTQQNIFD